MVEVMITSEGKQVKEEAELVVAVTLTRDADALLVRNICKGDFQLGSMAYGLGRAVDHLLDDASGNEEAKRIAVYEFFRGFFGESDRDEILEEDVDGTDQDQ